ncbi:hypothetical protein J6C36_02970 [Methanocorpusculaceae archaeon]|nr:hypothetical protein [Methanocorpusculaceae archaeon]MBO5119530.1 hypothetical protein [Methanocorpusculum sp.]MBO5368505.1 hypothetical protein [Methanocorpusculum sp.]
MKYEKVPDSIYEEYPDVYAYGEEYLIEDELFRKETEAELFCLFDELDALILDNMPQALVTAPASLIQAEFEKKTGLYLTRQEIVDAYLRFAGGYYE